MNFSNKKVLVVGTGKSGIAAAELLERHGADLIVFEGNNLIKKTDIMQKSKAFEKAVIWIGNFKEEELGKIELAVLSPGVPVDLPEIVKLKENNIPVIGEIELAYQCAKGDVLAITGTNGKTTTTTLLGEIMNLYSNDVKVVGNIGIPYTTVADETKESTIVVAEISSFQLETICEFRPKVSAILNITPDHLNRHHTIENYRKAKESITKNQTSDDYCVLNYENENLREFSKTISAKTIFFSSERVLQDGFYLDGDNIYFVCENKKEIVCNVHELNILGKHNYENVMAATAMAWVYGVPFPKIKEALIHFQAVEHRIEYVTEKRGIKFYNDSKGTNPDAAIKGIQAMNRPTFLIGGGYDKQSDYTEWIQAFEGKVRKLVLIGATKQIIADTAERLNFHAYEFANSLKEALQICYDNASEGDAILLSPACASWDMFKSYEERGDLFKEMVLNLKE